MTSKESYRLDIGKLRPKRHPETLAVVLGYRTPYRHDLLMDFLAFRAIRGVETVYRGRYARTCAIGGETEWITVEDDPAKSRLLLTVSESLAPHVAQLMAKTRRLFDTDCLPGEVSHALSGFHRQAGERYRIEGIRLPCSFGGFEMSVRAIIGQQITVKAANLRARRQAGAAVRHALRNAPRGAGHGVSRPIRLRQRRGRGSHGGAGHHQPARPGHPAARRRVCRRLARVGIRLRCAAEPGKDRRPARHRPLDGQLPAHARASLHGRIPRRRLRREAGLSPASRPRRSNG